MQNTTYAGDQTYGQSFKPEMELLNKKRSKAILSFTEMHVR